MKRHYPITILLISTMLLSGCLLEKEEKIKMETGENSNAAVLETSPENHDSQQTQAIDEIKIPGEQFTLVCKYDTGDYSLSDWRITDNKIINMTVSTNGLPDNYKAYIEHVHADIILKSTSPQIDGITQDSMDDQDHRTPTKGFPIGNKISYNNTFSIEGYTEQFYQLWGHAFGEYGNISSKYKRLTENNIRQAGTYAEKLAVVYDIIISTPECEEGYTRSVYSEVIIPLSSNINSNFNKGELSSTIIKDEEVTIVDAKFFSTDPVTYQTTIRYKATEYNNTDKEVYEQYKDKIGEKAIATVETKIYTSGYKEQCIVAIK